MFLRLLRSRLTLRPPGLAALMLVAALPLSAAPLSAQNSLASVWVADHKTLKRIDPETNRIAISVELAHEPEALAADPQDGGVWVLGDKELLRFDRAGNRLQTIALKPFPPRLEEPKLLALNPYDGSLWVADGKDVLHISA